MKQLAIFLAALVILTGCDTTSWNCEDGSGDMKLENIPVDRYHTVMYDRSGDIRLSRTRGWGLEIMTDDNLIDKFTTKIIDSVLYIQTPDDICPTEVVINCYMPNLKKVNMEGSGMIITRSDFVSDKLDFIMGGSGDIIIENVKADYTNIELDGSGDIEATDVDIDQLNCLLEGSGDIKVESIDNSYLECKLSGSGNINANGKTDSSYSWMGGSGNIKMDALQAGSARYILEGSGDIRAWANDYLYIRLRGSGDVYYRGDPDEKDIDIDGSGEIKQIN
jgi:hypothetical protein